MKTALFALLFLFSCATATPDPAQLQSEIQAEYDKLAAAFNRQDIDAVLSFRMPEFETFAPDGRRNDAEQMAEYTRNWLLVQNQPPIDSSFKVLSIEVRSPDEVAVRVLQRASRYREIEGKRANVIHEVTQRETWRRTPKGWKLRMVDEIDFANRKQWIEGVLQPPRPAP